MPTSTPLAIIEHDWFVSRAYHTYLCAQPEFDCVLVVRSVEQLLAELPTATRPPQLVLTSLDLPGLTTANGIQTLRQAVPGVAVVLIASLGDANLLFQALHAGAVGYVLVSNHLREMKATLLDVLAGGAPMSPAIARHLVRHFQQGFSTKGLTVDEQKLIQTIGEGLSYRLAAEQLGISLQALRVGIRQLYAKLSGNPELVNG